MASFRTLLSSESELGGGGGGEAFVTLGAIYKIIDLSLSSLNCFFIILVLFTSDGAD